MSSTPSLPAQYSASRYIISSFLQVGRDLHCGLQARLLGDKGGGGGGAGFKGRGDLRTLLFAGGQGLANSTFSHVGGLPSIYYVT